METINFYEARIIYVPCPECETPTNHKVLSNGKLICRVCGYEHEDTRPQWTAEEILEREG